MMIERALHVTAEDSTQAGGLCERCLQVKFDKKKKKNNVCNCIEEFTLWRKGGELDTCTHIFLYVN